MNKNIGLYYAKEDKSIFLDELIEKLKINPEAKLSVNEIQPDLHPNGKSIIHKSEFFSVIIIISKNNIETHWVQNALTLVGRQAVSDQHKIVPVFIDNSIVKEPLPAEQVVNLFDHNDYLFELYDIRSLAGLHISGHLKNVDKPTHRLLPDLPEYTNKLFGIICNEALSHDYPLISLPDILIKYHLSFDQNLTESLRIFESNNLIEQLSGSRTNKNSDQFNIRLLNPGLNKYLYCYFGNYKHLRKLVIELLLGSDSTNKIYLMKSEIISKLLKQPKLIINTILEDLEQKGKISLKRSQGENWEVSKVAHAMFENTLKKLAR